MKGPSILIRRLPVLLPVIGLIVSLVTVSVLQAKEPATEKAAANKAKMSDTEQAANGQPSVEEEAAQGPTTFKTGSGAIETIDMKVKKKDLEPAFKKIQAYRKRKLALGESKKDINLDGAQVIPMVCVSEEGAPKRTRCCAASPKHSFCLTAVEEVMHKELLRVEDPQPAIE